MLRTKTGRMMRIKLSRFNIDFKQGALVVTMELAEKPTKKLVPFLSELNRVNSELALFTLENPIALYNTMRDNSLGRGAWLLLFSSETSFQFAYYHLDILRLRHDNRRARIPAEFEMNKKVIWDIAVLDLMRVFDAELFRQHLKLEEPQEFRFNFSADPVTIQVREHPPFTLAQMEERGLHVAREFETLATTFLTTHRSSILLSKIHDIVQTIEKVKQLDWTRASKPEIFDLFKSLFVDVESVIIASAMMKISIPNHNEWLRAIAETCHFSKTLGVAIGQADIQKAMTCYVKQRDQALAFLSRKKIVYECGFPVRDGQGWPEGRSLENVEKLHTPQTQIALESNQLAPKINIPNEIPNDAIVVDIGAGVGRTLFDLRHHLTAQGKSAKLIAVGITPLQDRYLDAVDAVFYTRIPHCLVLLKELYGSVDYVIESYGATTYADGESERKEGEEETPFKNNPIHALIVAALLLKPNGKYRTIISGIQKLPDGTPIGFLFTRSNVKEFFKKHFNSELEVHETQIYSQVEGFIGTMMTDYIVTFTKPNFGKLAAVLPVEEYFARADRLIGLAVPYHVRDEFGQFKKFNIKANSYNGDTSTLNTRDLVEFGLTGYQIESAYAIGHQLRIALTFKNEQTALLFHQKFSEKYLQRGNCDWLIEPNGKIMLISFCPFESQLDYYRERVHRGTSHELVYSQRVSPTTQELWNHYWRDAFSQLAESWDNPFGARFISYPMPKDNPLVLRFDQTAIASASATSGRSMKLLRAAREQSNP